MDMCCVASIIKLFVKIQGHSIKKSEPFCKTYPHFVCPIPYVPKKITIGLSAWITFKVVNESEYNFV